MIVDKRFAVLIDADNVSAKYIKYIMDEMANYGIVTYKRIYGDWTKPNAAAWKEVLLENSVTPVQQYSYTTGKNATDSAMIIDAMDILYSGYVDGYCVVSSDSDFTKLSSRLRESGMTVIGMGERKTPKPFIAACNQFKYLDIIAESEKKMEMDGSQINPPANNKLQPNIPNGTNNGSTNGKHIGETNESKSMTDINVIKLAIVKMLNESDEESQSLNMAEIGNRLAKRYPDFDVRNYGDTKLSKFLKKFDFLTIHPGDGNTIMVSFKSTDFDEQSMTMSPRTKKRTAKKTTRPKKKMPPRTTTPKSSA